MKEASISYDSYANKIGIFDTVKSFAHINLRGRSLFVQLIYQYFFFLGEYAAGYESFYF